MSLAVDEPILNNPFEEPKEYWVYEEGHPKKMYERRPGILFPHRIRELIHKIRKGYESEQDRQKKVAAERWVKAVNYHGGYGIWELMECRDPRSLNKILNGLFQ